MLTLYTRAGGAQILDAADTAPLHKALADKTPFWLNLGQPDPGEFHVLAEVFGFHPLAIEDATRPFQRPKIDEYEGYFFLTANEVLPPPSGATVPAGEDDVQVHQIASFLGESYFVTVDTAGAHAVSALADRVKRSPQVFEHGADYLLYALLDHIVDDYFPILEELENHMDEVEAKVMETPDPSTLSILFAARKRGSRLRRTASPMREVLQTLTTRDFPLIREATIPYLRDVSDHLYRIAESLDVSRDLSSNLLDAYLSQQNNQMSRAMQKMSAIATVFMPITFITGVFGMNFARQPWAGTSVWWWIGLMAILAIGMYLWFRRRRWF